MFKCLKCHRTVEWIKVPGHFDPCKQCGRYVYDYKSLVGEVANAEVCKTSTTGSNPVQESVSDEKI